MPQEVEIDGKKQTVYTEEEVQPLQAGHDANASKKETITKLGETLKIDGDVTMESLTKKVDELKEDANPNFKAVREVIKNLKIALKEKGVEVDEKTGEIKTNEKGVSKEEIADMIKKGVEEGVTEELSKVDKGKILGGFNEEDRKKIGPVFDKLMKLGGTAEENLGIAEAKVFPDREPSTARKAYNGAVGDGAPASGAGGDNSDFAQSDQGKSAGKAMGLTSFKEKPAENKEGDKK